MSDLTATADALISMAHKIVWASVVTVDAENRP
jgi:hypothetical protein